MRLDALHQQLGELLEIEWRAFLLRPTVEERPLDKFTRYTERWLLGPGAAEPDAPFHVWSGAQAPPSHSMPSWIAGKAVLHEFGADGFDRFHLALMRAYFADNRTISDRAVILDVAASVGLDADALAARLDSSADALAAEVIADHKAALAAGIAAVPTAVVNDEYMLQGAMPREQYHRVVSRLAS